MTRLRQYRIDPVTGTASGVMGAYYLTYIKPELSSAKLVVEQGQ
ncbi:MULTISPECIES: hypothetical protein [Bacillales]|nr:MULTISPECIES: hypothetical protein [Bacillales]